MSTTLRPATVITTVLGVSVLGFLGYAIYFDRRRRTDPAFRKALKRDAKKSERIARTQAEASANAKGVAIKQAVDAAKQEGFPKEDKDKEAYFMEMISQGEVLGQQADNEIEAALCFYRALKVYPAPAELVNIYDQTVSKPVLDVLAEMIAYDSSINVREFRKSSPSGSQGSHHGVDD